MYGDVGVLAVQDGPFAAHALPRIYGSLKNHLSIDQAITIAHSVR